MPPRCAYRLTVADKAFLHNAQFIIIWPIPAAITVSGGKNFDLRGLIKADIRSDLPSDQSRNQTAAAGGLLCRQREVHLDAQTFAIEVIQNVQRPDRTAVCKLVCHFVTQMRHRGNGETSHPETASFPVFWDAGKRRLRSNVALAGGHRHLFTFSFYRQPEFP